MKTVNLEDWIRENQQEFARRRPRGSRRDKIRRRPRDPDEEAILIRLTCARWKRWLAEGKIVEVGPRHFRLT